MVFLFPFLFFLFILVCFLRRSLALSPRLAPSWLSATSASWVQAILLPQPPGFIWDYRHVPPPCPANFCIFSWVGWSWTPDLRWSAHLGLPKCWNYRHELPRPAYFFCILHIAQHCTGYSLIPSPLCLWQFLCLLLKFCSCRLSASLAKGSVRLVHYSSSSTEPGT